METLKMNKVSTFILGLIMAAILLGFSGQAQAAKSEYRFSGYYTYTVIDGQATIEHYSFTKYNRDVGDITIPSTLGGFPVKCIGTAAFSSCSELTSISIPEGVTSIGKGVFSGCVNLRSISIPTSVTSIGYCAFVDCESLTSITLPQGLTSIDDYAFADCTGLTSITFNSATTTISKSDGSIRAGTIPTATKIIGHDPSTAKDYAIKYNRLFEVISTAPVLSASAAPVTTPKVILDGINVSFDVPPSIENGRVMMPLRAIFEAMGAKVSWDSNTMTATAVKGNTTVVFKIGSLEPMVNGIVKPIDVAGKVVGGRTLAPLRFVCEAFGGTVEWAADTQTVIIKSAEEN